MARVIRIEDDITIYRANKLDANGNPRHIVHFLDFLTEEERENNGILEGVELVKKKIKKSGFHFRYFSNREFGGGFITQGDYANGKETAWSVRRIRDNY